MDQVKSQNWNDECRRVHGDRTSNVSEFIDNLYFPSKVFVSVALKDKNNSISINMYVLEKV